jgi:hypothetical protein
MIKSQKNDNFQCVADVRAAFARSYDETRCRDFIEKNRLFDAPKMEPDGEGTYFCVYKLSRTGAMDLAIKVLKSEKAKSFGLKAWLERVKTLKAIQTDLIPPFRVLTFDQDCMAYVMPYGTKNVSFSEVATQWQELDQKLRGQNLVLDDVPQLQSCHGFAFVSDWSDLRSTI